MARILAILCLMLLPQLAAAQQVRQMINGLRSEQGLGSVTPSPRLEAAAMAHAMDMAQNNFFGHEGSDGTEVGDRATEVGYNWCLIAENIARGQGSTQEVLGAWARSAPHRRNILLEDVTEYGLVRGPGDIWVLVLGQAGC